MHKSIFFREECLPLQKFSNTIIIIKMEDNYNRGNSYSDNNSRENYNEGGRPRRKRIFVKKDNDSFNGERSFSRDNDSNGYQKRSFNRVGQNSRPRRSYGNDRGYQDDRNGGRQGGYRSNNENGGG